MQARMTNPAIVLPQAMKGINLLCQAAHSAGLAREMLDLVHLRASQINGCGACVDAGARGMRKNGEPDERIFSVAAWRETPYYSDAERAALAHAENATRMADRVDAVPDDVWHDAERHFAESELAALLVWIATTNLFNRLNATTRQQAPQAW